MGTMTNLPASVLRSPLLLAEALRTGKLGDDTADVLDVLRILNQASAFKSQDLGAALDSWHKAANKEQASARIAAILESRARELASIVEQASGFFLGTVRFESHGRLVAKISRALKAPTVAKNIIFGAELAKIAEAGFEKIQKEMLVVPGGTFQMGYDGPKSYDWEKPVHEVSLSSFQMSEFPATTGGYSAWVESLEDRRFFLVRLDPKTGWPQVIAQGDKVSIEAFKNEMTDLETLEVWEVESYPYHPKYSEQPGLTNAYCSVQMVNWYQSYLYSFIHGCRLPTEAEWAFVMIRSGQYKYLSESGAHNAAHNVEVVQGPVVASFPGRGIGRSWFAGEWVMDWYGQYPSGAVTDPKGPITGNNKVYVGKVIFFHGEILVRASDRGNDPPTEKSSTGFRLVRPLGPPK